MKPKKSYRHITRRAVIACASLATSVTTVCAAPPALPANVSIESLRGVDAGLLGQNIANRPSAGKQALRISGAALQQKPTSGSIPGAEKISFILKGVNISGNKTFSTSELEDIFKPYLNKKITLAQLLDLINGITEKYQKSGYFLSKAILPPQDIDKDHGIIQVQVVEGFISKVNIEGISERQKSLVESYANEITSSRPLKYATLERYLLLINDLPGIDAQAVIAPDPSTPYASQLTLVSKYTPFQAAISYDNYGTRYLGPQETTLHTALNSAIIPGGTLYSTVLVTADPAEMKYVDLHHDQAIGSNGLTFGLGSYYVATHPQFVLSPLDMYGKSTDVYTNLSYPILRSRKRTVTVKTQFEYLDSRTTALGQELYFDRIRDLSIGANYQDTLWHGTDEINLTGYKGFQILGAGDSGPLSREEGNSDFIRAAFSISRDQSLGKRFSVYGLITSQYANVPLIAAEEFTFGGPYLGRGYDLAQFSGDEGVAGKIELRMNTAPNLPFLKQVQYYTFYDNGIIWNLDEVTTTPRQTASSAGAGFRANLISHLNAEAFIAKPLTTPNATQVILNENGHALMAYFQLVAYL